MSTTEKERRSFVLCDDEILSLARWAQIIEKHYGRPMDMEWAKDGQTEQAVHRPGAAGDRAVAQGRRTRSPPSS